MAQEVIACLAPVPGGVYLDGTVGGGGHARLILEASAPDGRLIGLDRDRDALASATAALAPFGKRALLKHGRFADADRILMQLGVEAVDGILLDLGVSSYQLDTPQRGFSFRDDGPLDMRMDQSNGPTAADVINRSDESELARIFRDYGEERHARRIARRIVAERSNRPLVNTRQLAELIRESVPGGQIPSRIHPATRVFQALRIFVNGELDQVRNGVTVCLGLLKPGGRMAVISFHSLEDRIVKHCFRDAASGCICPPRLPYCQCGRTPVVEILTRKALRPSQEEVDENPRARSAVLRAVRKCGM